MRNAAKRNGLKFSLSSGHNTSPGKEHTVAKIPSRMQECMCTCTVNQAKDSGHVFSR